MVRRCVRCREPVSPDDEFCGECGVRIIRERPTPTVRHSCPRCKTPWQYGRPPVRTRDILAVAIVGGLGAVLGLWLGPAWGLDASFALVVAPVLVVGVLATLTALTAPRTRFCPQCGRRRDSDDITLTQAMGILGGMMFLWAIWLMMSG